MTRKREDDPQNKTVCLEVSLVVSFDAASDKNEGPKKAFKARDKEITIQNTNE